MPEEQSVATGTAAIAVHSAQADLFAERYEAPDPYGDCFSYSRRRLDELLWRHVPSDGTGLRALDLGCGTGHQLARLHQRGFEVVGVDGSAEMLDHAATVNPGAELHRADVAHTPLPAASVDLVLCIEVLRYLRDPEPCLAEIARVLRPGGRCLVTAAPRFNLNGYWALNRLAAAAPLPGLTRLRQFFTTSRRLRRRLEAAGLDEVRVEGVYLGPVNWVERIAPRALPHVLRRWEPLDRRLADRRALRELANMFLAGARRP